MRTEQVADALSLISEYIVTEDIPLQELITLTAILVRIAETVADKSNALASEADEDKSEICNGDMGPECVPAE